MKETFSVYRLSPDEVERFDATFRGDLFMKEIFEVAAAQWRTYRQARNKSMEACRRHFLRTIIIRNGSRFSPLPYMEELPSLARYLCMRVEQRVLELDASA